MNTIYGNVLFMKFRLPKQFLLLLALFTLHISCTDSAVYLPYTDPPRIPNDPVVYKADTMIVRSILDSAGYRATSNEAHTSVRNSRIVSLWFPLDTNIKVLLPIIGELSALETLDIRNTGIANLPSQIGRLQQLKVLRMNVARVVTLPDSLTNCTALTTLYCDNCRLKELPESIGNLQNLRVAEFGFNFLDSLPQSILTIKTLGSINIMNNRLCTVSAEVSTWLNSHSTDGDGWPTTQQGCTP